MIKSKHFHVIGVSHKTADIDLRSQFNLNETQLHGLFLEAKEAKLKDLLVINTCNRTEIYAWTNSEETLIELLCKHTGTSRNLLTYWIYS